MRIEKDGELQLSEEALRVLQSQSELDLGFPGCCTSRVEQPALQSYICSVTVFVLATSENILVSAIFSVFSS